MLMAIVTSQTVLQLVVDSTVSHISSIDSTHQIQCSSLSTIVARRIKESFTTVLTKFHAGYFRVSLSLGGQALLWKTLIGPTDNKSTFRLALHTFHPRAFTLLWSFALVTLVLLSILYLLRCLFYFKMVKDEFLHDVGVNYLFAPSISWLLLLQSAPFFCFNNPYSYVVLWLVFAVPIVVLDVKIYGQWFTKGKKILSAIANRTSHLSVIANLVGAQAAANMGWNESAICFFSVGMVHYLVLFVTLYQRFSGTDLLPTMLRPALFLYFAAPSMASLAWQSIAGSFDTASKMLFFLSLFLFMSLVLRPTLFKRSMRRFNVAWWAFSFPLSVLALASMEYAEEVKSDAANLLMLLLLTSSVIVSVGLIIFTLLNTHILVLPHNSDPISSLPTLRSNSTTTASV
ncbi:hypothetical protein PVK06_015470 [Gossypium arboreum]|uniref:S-type anion channel SLAH1-like n=2 Tax=Gossypium arboreum TaxID=29729 RepID=A0ABR0PXF0_GOSAR|nr:hypothetical protein PVK06_015470 [Gossypium arboreum]